MHSAKIAAKDCACEQARPATSYGLPSKVRGSVTTNARGSWVKVCLLAGYPECMPWYFATRAIGVFMVLFGLLVDKSSERGTIIVTGAGLAGFDRVVRKDDEQRSKNE
jgi:hypothetical protein